MTVTVTRTAKVKTRQCNWTSICPTEDGKILFTMGNSHNAQGDNSVNSYDPVTDTWTELAPDTGHLFNLDTHQFDPDPVTGVTPFACTNRDNHQLLYIPAMRSLVVIGNITTGPWGGRFDIDAGPDWAEVWETEADCAASFIAGMADETQNSAHAWSAVHNCGFAACGTKSGTATNRLMVYAPNPTGPQPYKLIDLNLPIEDRFDLRAAGVCRGDWFYFGGGRLRYSKARTAEFYRVYIPDALNGVVNIERLADLPAALRYPLISWNTDLDLGMLFGGSTDTGSTNLLATYDAGMNVWTTHDNAADSASIPSGCYLNGLYVGFTKRYDPVTGDAMGWQDDCEMDRLVVETAGGGVAPEPIGITQAEALAAVDTESAFVNGEGVSQADALAANDLVRQYIEQ